MRRTLLIASLVISATPVLAQSRRNAELRLGVGTFLTHDRGWNYSEPIELFVSVIRNTGSVALEAGVSVYKTLAEFGQPAEFPRRPGAFHDGMGARLHLRAPNAPHSSMSTIIGAEIIQNRTEGEQRTTTLAGTAGVSVNFGPDGNAGLDLRYVVFADRLGSSKGILPLSLAWRF